MSFPQSQFDLDRLNPQVFDPSSPEAAQEWETFLQRRTELLDQIMGRLGLSGEITQNQPITGFPAADELIHQDLENRALEELIREAPQTPPTPGNAPRPLTNQALNELLGAAEHYDIPNAEQYSPEALQTLVEQRRLASRANPDDDLGILSYLGRAFYTGVVGELFDTAGRVPFIGDALAKKDWFNESDQWLGALRESVLADVQEDDEALLRVGLTGAGMLGYALPATAAWRTAGAGLNILGLRGSLPVAFRYALQGGLTAAMLEAGGDAPIGQRATTVALGGLFGGAIGRGGPVAGGAVGGMLGAAVGGTIEPGPEGTATGAVAGAALGLALPLLMAKAQRSFTTRMTQPTVGTRRPGQAGPEGIPFDDIPEADFTVVSGELSPGAAPRGTGAPPAPGAAAPPPVPPPATTPRGTPVPSPVQAQPQLPLPTAQPQAPVVRGILPAVSNSTLAQEAANLSKHQAIVESPLAPELAQQSVFNDFDVFRAMLASGIGGNEGMVLRGVNMDEFVLGVVSRMDDAVSGELLTQVATVERDGVTHLLHSTDPMKLESMVSEYKKAGVFTGQRVIHNGQEVDVVSVGSIDGLPVVRLQDTIEQGPVFDALNLGELQPLSHGSDVDTQATYALFKDWAQQRLMAEYKDTSFSLSDLDDDLDAPENLLSLYLSNAGSTQLPRLAEEFAGGTFAPFEIPAIMDGISRGYTQDLKELAHEEWVAADLVAQESADLRNMREHSQEVVPVSTEEMADAKGLRLEVASDPSEGFGVITDEFSDLQIPVATEEQARLFLQTFERQIPDLDTPSMDLPADLLALPPGSETPLEGITPTAPSGGSVTTSIEATAEAMSQAEIAIARNQLRREGGELPPPGGGGGSGPPVPPSQGGLVPAGSPQNPRRQVGADFARLRRDDPVRLARAMQKTDNLLLRWVEPMRNWTLTTQQMLQNDLGIDSAALWEDYANVSNNYGTMHNAMIPWMERWSGIVGGFRRKFRRDGTVVRIEQIPNFNDKLAAMQEAGYTPAEMDAQEAIRPYFDEAWGFARETNPNIGYLFDYLPALRRMQNVGAQQDPFAKWENDTLPQDWRWFARYARDYGVQAQHADIGTLGTVYTRGLFFERHVAPSWNAMSETWSDPRIPEQLKTPVQGWLNLVLTGQGPQDDVMVKGFRHFLNKVGVPVTDSEVRSAWGGTFGAMYRAGLGLSPYHLFRDSIQPWFVGTEIGFKWVNKAYTSWLKGDEGEKLAMIRRAEEFGYVERGQTQVALAEVFSQPATLSGGEPLFTEGQQARREGIAVLMDRLYDMTPGGLKQGMQGTIVDPLLAYTKLGEFNRIVAGEAGWLKADEAMAGFLAGNVSRADLTRRSGASVYPQPIQDKFGELVDSGRHVEAVALMAQEAANSQFRYGTKEQSVAIQQAGVVGKMATMYGTFTMQYIGRMRDGLRGATRGRPEAVAFAGRQALMWAAVSGAAAFTGWKGIHRWKWHRSLSFGGGPLATSLIKGVQAAPGAVNTLFGENPTPEQRSAMSQLGIRSPFQTFFPFARGISTIEGIGAGLNTPFPAEATAQFLLTGESGAGRHMKTLFDDVLPGRWVGGVSPDTLARARGVSELEGTTQEAVDAAFDPNRSPGTILDSLMGTFQPGAEPDLPDNAGMSDADSLGSAPPAADPLQDLLPPQADSGAVARQDPTLGTGVVYEKNGRDVYDSTNRDPGGSTTPTHVVSLIRQRLQPGQSVEMLEQQVLQSNPAEEARAHDSRLESLDTDFAGAMQTMLAAAQEDGFGLSVRETLRTQDRQDWLFQQGRSRPGDIITWTLTSDHTSGRAADVGMTGIGRLRQSAALEWIQTNAPRFGLTVLGAADPGHVSMPLGQSALDGELEGLLQGGGGAF